MLGGHDNITHLDTGVVEFLVDKFNVSSVLDIGCGPGGMSTVWEGKGVEFVGIDGDPVFNYSPLKSETLKRGGKYLWNLEFPPPLKLEDFNSFNICWSVEFLEHLEEEFLPHVFSLFSLCNYVFCTASQNPHPKFHVNVQPCKYWIEKFESYGFEYLSKESEEIKLASNMPRNFIRDTGMLFLNPTYKV